MCLQQKHKGADQYKQVWNKQSSPGLAFQIFIIVEANSKVNKDITEEIKA